MYLVVRRGAVEELDRLGELGGAAAVACLRAFADEPAVAQWLRRPGKVVLRARSPSQWERVLAEPHAVGGEGVIALPPRRRSERSETLMKIQAMSTELEPPPSWASAPVLYALNPGV